MVSKVLTKLIDKAIVPAVLLLATRIVSIVAVSKYLKLSFDISMSGFIFENSADYIMMAEVDNPLTLMQLMNTQNMDPRLKTFGDMMKQYADGPIMKAYTVIAKTNESKTDKVNPDGLK